MQLSRLNARPPEAVGFGDIFPTSTWERLYILLLMVISTVLFSRLMGDMHDVMQLSTRDETEVSERLEGVVSFLRANRVPSALQKRIRGWAGFKLLHDRTDEQLQEVMGLLPENLRIGVAQVLPARTACQGWCPP